MRDMLSRFDGHGIGEEDITDEDVTAQYPPVPAARQSAQDIPILFEADKSMRLRILMATTVALMLALVVGGVIVLLKVFL